MMTNAHQGGAAFIKYNHGHAVLSWNFIHIDLDIIRTSNLLKVNAYEIYHKIWNLFSFSHLKGISLCIINIKDCVKIIDLLQNYSLHFNHIFLVHLDVTCWQNMIEYYHQVIAHPVHINTYSIFWILRCTCILMNKIKITNKWHD